LYKKKARWVHLPGPLTFYRWIVCQIRTSATGVDSDGVPHIIVSYIRATDSLATIKIFIFYAGRIWALKPESRGTTLPGHTGRWSENSSLTGPRG
jgi:hypothetical protein